MIADLHTQRLSWDDRWLQKTAATFDQPVEEDADSDNDRGSHKHIAPLRHH